MASTIENNHHPITKAKIFSKLCANWISKFLKDRKKNLWTKEKNYPLPQRDKSQKNFQKCSESFKKAKNQMLPAIILGYKSEFTHLALISIFYLFLNYSTVIVLKQAVHTISSSSKEELRTKKVAIGLIARFIYICLVSPLAELIARFFTFTSLRLANAVKGGICLLIFEKVTKIYTMNPSGTSAGQIVNYLQVDVNKLDKGLPAFVTFTRNMIEVIVLASMMFYLVGKTLLIMLIITCFNMFIFSFIYRAYHKASNTILIKKDSRINFLRNVLRNIRYIKMRSYENFFQYKICGMRELELKSLLRKQLMVVAIVFMNWFNPNTSLLTIIMSFYWLGIGGFSFDKFSAFLRLFQILRGVLMSLPDTLANSVDLFVSFGRIEFFLTMEEVNFDFVTFVKEIEEENDQIISLDGQGKNCLEIKNGNFGWEDTKNLTKKQKSKKTNQKGKMTQNSLNETLLSSTGSSEIPDLTLTSETPNENHDILNQAAFSLKSINLSIPKGSLTIILGKIGSGKSSLLYSLLSEMPLIFNYETNLSKPKTACFLSQNPWILPSTILYNITLQKDEKVDQIRLEAAIRLSQLEEDLKLMQQGINTEVGEQGLGLSGGQRTRLVLARCFYQK